MLLKNKYIILYGIVLAGIIAHSVYRDIQLEKQYPGDLRNRVVGARLQKDGKLPYFYFWTPRDGTRYVDPGNRNQSSAFLSNITASPFFHQLLYPLCDLPQRTISRIWMWLQYFFLAGMVLMICSLTGDHAKRLVISGVAVLFTITEAWKNLISAGQIYLFVALLISCIIAGLVNNKKPGIIFASLCAVALVLCRPIALVVFIPFLVQYKKHILFLLASISGLALYILFVLFTPYENTLWKSYYRAVEMHAQYHQHPLPESEIPRGPRVAQEEGFDFSEIEKNAEEHPITIDSECGNAFLFYEYFFHRKMPISMMGILSVILVISLCGAFFYVSGKHPPQPLQIMILGFLLYLIAEFFSPIHRHQYNTVQWFPVVLAGLLLLKDWRKTASLLLFLGLLLNIINIPWILMRHTLGELCWLLGLLIIVYTIPENQTAWKQQS